MRHNICQVFHADYKENKCEICHNGPCCKYFVNIMSDTLEYNAFENLPKYVFISKCHKSLIKK